MKHATLAELTQSKASLAVVITAAGGDTWSRPAIEKYMEAEAKKLRPNVLYRLAQFIPGPRKLAPAHRLDAAMLIIFLGLVAVTFASAVVSVPWFMMSLGSDFISGSFSVDVILQTISLVLVVSGVMLGGFLFLVDRPIIVQGPGYWKTVAFDSSAEQYATPDVLKCASILRSMVPAARLEISLLFQDKTVLDPVLWVVEEGQRYAVRVWDKDGKDVLPH